MKGSIHVTEDLMVIQPSNVLSVNCVYDFTYLLANLQKVCLRAHTCCIHDRSHVDAAAPVKETPDNARHEDAECLREQNERHPLVVADHRTALVHKTFSWNCLYHWQIVSIADPADGISVVDVAVGELRRTPASDRMANELFSADKRREADENDYCVLSVETIHVVIVHTELHFAHC